MSDESSVENELYARLERCALKLFPEHKKFVNHIAADFVEMVERRLADRGSPLTEDEACKMLGWLWYAKRRGVKDNPTGYIYTALFRGGARLPQPDLNMAQQLWRETR